MPILKHTPQSLLVLAAGPRLLRNRKRLEKMVGLVEGRRRLMLANINVAENGCWLWVGSVNHHGYGKIGLRGKSYRVHRLIWMCLYGWIPRRVKVCHDCDNPPCCNPSHLFAGTQQDNLKDMRVKGRHVRGEKMPHSVLTEDDVRDMRRRKAAGEHWKSIWIDFPIGWRAFFRVIKGERWAHVK